jgi:hypothetical protein
MSGHFYVVDGDLSRIACDAWLLPTDNSFSITASWSHILGMDSPSRLEESPWRSNEFARPFRSIDRSEVWLGKVGGQGTEGFVAAATQFVTGAAGRWRELARQQNRRPLLAINQIGSGHGGGKFHKGEGLPAVMDAVRDLLEEDTIDADVVLVTWGETAKAAAQWYRRSNEWYLDRNWQFIHRNDALHAEARRLADVLKENQASIFLGAGVSAGAGLPTWNDLLEKVGASCTIPLRAEDIARIGDPRDIAALLASRLAKENPPRSLGSAMAAQLAGTKFSLQHSLLASLPCSEYITTNVDDLFEKACTTNGRSIDVAPAISRDSRRWLLKLHGSVTEPETMVFTRDSYLAMTRQSRALMGLVQAMLLTRHMIFVGYGLRDEDFHELMYEVRSAFPEGKPAKELGTVLSLIEDPLQAELWGDTVKVISFHPPLPHDATSDDRASAMAVAIPELQKFLDLVGLHATESSSFVLDRTYETMLTEEEETFAKAIHQLLRTQPQQGELWKNLRTLLDRFGLPRTGEEHR